MSGRIVTGVGSSPSGCVLALRCLVQRAGQLGFGAAACTSAAPAAVPASAAAAGVVSLYGIRVEMRLA